MSSYFNSYIDKIDVDFWRNLCINSGELRHYKKGEEFITAGTVGRYIGYIESGSLKYVCYSADGTPNVIGLEFAGHFVCDFPFSIFQKKSRVSIIATTPCDIHCVPVKWITQQIESDTSLRTIVADTTYEILDTVYNRYVDLYTKSVQQRYNELISMDSNLFSLFSLQDIASVLNITPTHLSRLRKK